jgi:DNA (cytosine-5)-methyltransferase 1
MIRVGSDFSGVGAFNQALNRLGIKYEEVFACDMDKYARQTFIHNYGEPRYYPTNVYYRNIPEKSLDIYMTSPPCQAFSLAGKRLGKTDNRGVLFFNSHEFIEKNKPRFFIFENVKGLLSDDNGKTFQEWVNMLGGKSVNGSPVMFPHEYSVPYHLYWKVLNAKEHGVPQNRERVFLVGIRDDQDNVFRWPLEEHLTKRLKDVLEDDVDGKYFLQTLDTACNQGVMIGDYRTDEGFRWRQDGNSPCLMASMRDKWSEKFTAQNPPITTNSYKIRRLTPRECFRLMDFPDTFTWPVSDSQAYKQAGNSIVVNVLYKIIKNLPLCY